MKHPAHSTEIDGVTWYSDTPETLEQLPGILETGERRELKRNKYRSIHAIPTPDPVVLKLFEDPRVSQQMRERLTASHAHKEWHASRKLRALGIGTVRGIAYGEKQDGMSAFLMEALPDVRSLSDLLADRNLLHQDLHHVVQELAQSVHKMHAAGICHRDLHGSNILVSQNGIHILDLQTIWYLSWFPLRAREKNLEQLFYTFEHAGRIGGALRFCRSYLDISGHAEDARALFRRLQQWSHRRAQKHYRSQTQRAVRGGSQFQVHRQKPARVYRSGIDPEEMERILPSLKGNSPLPLTHHGDPVEAWVKGFGLKADPTDRRRAQARSRRAWIGLRALEVREIPSPKGLAWMEGEPGTPCWIIMEMISEAEPLGRWFRANAKTLAPALRHELARTVARFSRKIHHQEIYHNDWSPKNFLVKRREDGWEIHLVDPEAVQPSRSLSERRKIRNLSQIADLGSLSTRTDRLRFLKTYLGEVPRKEWEPIARKAWAETKRRIEARIARTGETEPTEP